MALDNVNAIADAAVRQNGEIPHGKVATTKTVTMDGTKTHKAAHKESTQIDTEGSQQKTAVNPGTPSMDTAVPVVNALGTSPAAPAVVSGPSNAAAIARDAVMITPELLECIISFLPSRDIFSTAQRLSRTWKTVVQSPAIQTRLWRRSRASEVAVPVDYSAFRRKPADGCPGCLPIYSEDIAHNRIFTDGDYLRSINDRCIYINSDPPGGPTRSFDFRRMSLRIPTMPSNTLPTWLDMYLTQPRIMIARLVIQVSDAQPQVSRGDSELCWHHYDTVSLKDADGLTFMTALAVANKIRSHMTPTFLSGRKDSCHRRLPHMMLKSMAEDRLLCGTMAC